MGRIALVFAHGFLSPAKVWSAFTKMIEADRELQAGFDVRPFEYARTFLSRFHRAGALRSAG